MIVETGQRIAECCTCKINKEHDVTCKIKARQRVYVVFLKQQYVGNIKAQSESELEPC